MLTLATTTTGKVALQSLPVGAEQRGKLRLWKSEQARRLANIERALESGRVTKFAEEFVQRESLIGRQRVLKKLRMVLGQGAHVAHCELSCSHPFAYIAVINPQGADVVASDEPSDSQPNITIEYLAIGSLFSGNRLSRGFWGLQIPDHALGRAVQRLPRVDLTATVLDAHANALALRIEQIAPYSKECRAFVLKAGDGAFTVLAWATPRLTGQEQLFLRAETWVADDMRSADRAVLGPDNETGERIKDRLLRPF